jgi:hypothetical protein
MLEETLVLCVLMVYSGIIVVLDNFFSCHIGFGTKLLTIQYGIVLAMCKRIRHESYLFG